MCELEDMQLYAVCVRALKARSCVQCMYVHAYRHPVMCSMCARSEGMCARLKACSYVQYVCARLQACSYVQYVCAF